MKEEQKPTSKRHSRRRAKLNNDTIRKERAHNRELAHEALGQYNLNQLPKILKGRFEVRRRVYSMLIAGAEVPTISKTLRTSLQYVRQCVKDLEQQVKAMERTDAASLIFSVFQSTMDNYRNNQVELLVQRNALEQHRGRCEEYIRDLAKGESVPDGSPRTLSEGFTANTMPVLNEAERKQAERAEEAAQERKDKLRAIVQGLHQEIATCNRGILEIMQHQRLNDKESWSILSQMGVPDMTPPHDDGTHTHPENAIISAESTPLLGDGTVDLEAVKADEKASLERRLAALED